MDRARCMEENVIYTAAEFSRLDPTDSDRKRRLLQCPECSGPAFFRNTSRNGRMPCFGARPHSATCTLAAQDVERFAGFGEDRGALSSFGQRIVFDFHFGAQGQPECSESLGLTLTSHRSDRFGGHCGHLNASTSRRLSSVLRALVANPNFGHSDHIIEILGRCESVARDFFVPLLSTTKHYAGLFKGYWGLLSDARFALDGALWLNSGGWDSISFCLNAKHVEEFGRRYSIDDVEDLAGAYVLVIGTPQIARNGKLFCFIEDLAYIALRLT
jgi:hypothetical protein